MACSCYVHRATHTHTYSVARVGRAKFPQQNRISCVHAFFRVRRRALFRFLVQRKRGAQKLDHTVYTRVIYFADCNHDRIESDRVKTRIGDCAWTKCREIGDISASRKWPRARNRRRNYHVSLMQNSWSF